jgi:SagB-type dehydrogenase family enzyme
MAERDVPIVPFGAAAVGFHRASSFGKFVEPLPPFNLSHPSNPSEDGLQKGSRLEPSNASSALKAQLGDVLNGRVSSRAFDGRGISLRDLLTLLWAADGRVGASTDIERRTAPSAGGLFPIRMVVVSAKVVGLRPGVHEYVPAAGQLAWLVEAPVDWTESWFRTRHVDFSGVAAVIFFLVRFDGILPKYGERGYRYALLEVGHVAQNVCLAATSLTIAHIPLGGFDDDIVNTALQIDGVRQAAVYSVTLG